MHVLGLSFYYHDSSAALVSDGVLVAAAEEKRFSRVKHDSGFPSLAIEFVLERAGLTINDVDHVVFYEKPFVKFERLLLSSMATFPRSSAVFVHHLSCPASTHPSASTRQSVRLDGSEEEEESLCGLESELDFRSLYLRKSPSIVSRSLPSSTRYLAHIDV